MFNKYNLYPLNYDTFSDLLPALLKETTIIWNPRLPQPIISSNKCTNCKITSFIATNQMISRPSYPLIQPWARPPIAELGIIQRAHTVSSGPKRPSRGTNQTIQEWLHNHHSRIWPPWSPEKCRDDISSSCQVGRGLELTPLETEPGVLVGIRSRLCCNCDTLAWQWHTCINVTILEHCSCISKYEIDRPVDVAVPVKLSHGVSV